MWDVLAQTTRSYEMLCEEARTSDDGGLRTRLIPGMNNASMDLAWETFCRFLWSKDKVWLTHGEAYVITPRKEDDLLASGFPWSVYFMSTPIREEKETLDDDYDFLSLTVHARELTAAASACEFLLGLMALSQQQQQYITIGNGYSPDGKDRPFPISGPTLSNFFQEIHHRKVTLAGITLDEEQCRALATVSSLDLEIILERCSLAPDDIFSCQKAFIECLQRDRGPTELDRCLISHRIIANALIGNIRVVKLRIACGEDESEIIQDHAGIGIMFRALTEMRGLLELNLYDHFIMDDHWHILCQSLKMHRTLTCLDLRYTQRWDTLPMITNERKMRRIRGIAEVLKVNTLLHTIKLSPFKTDHQIFNESVTPRLEMNRYRPRVLAVKQAGPDNRFRRALLGQALQSPLVRNKSNVIWMLLSENADVVVESIER
jgi:hypothetical protein